jgi:hypothetical protein
MTKTFLLACLTFLSVACVGPNKKDNSSQNDHSDKVNNGIETIIINSDQAVECTLNEIIKEYSIIALEMTTESVIGVPERVLIKGGLLFVKEKDLIHIYNTTGSHIATINKKGRGPGEYIQILGFDFDQQTNRVVIADHSKIHFFDLKGNYLSSIKSPWRVFEIASFDNRFVISPYVVSANPENDYNINLTDTNLRIIDRRDKMPIWEGPFYAVSGTTLRSSNLSSSISYASLHGDTIFSIDQDKIEPRYVLNYNKKHYVTFSYRPPSDDSYIGIVFRETDSMIIVDYTDNLTRDNYLIVMNKDSLGHLIHVKNDLLIFDNISDEGPYEFVPSGRLKSTISRFDEDLTLCMNASIVKGYLNDELKHNGFLIQYRWK